MRGMGILNLQGQEPDLYLDKRGYKWVSTFKKAKKKKKLNT